MKTETVKITYKLTGYKQAMKDIRAFEKIALRLQKMDIKVRVIVSKK